MNCWKRRTVLWIACSLLSVHGVAFAGGGYTVRSDGITLRISERGEIAGVSLGPNHRERVLSGGTFLEGCRSGGGVEGRALPGGGVEFTKTLAREDGGRSLNLVERFTPAEGSIHWEIELTGSGAAWSTPVMTRLRYPVTPDLRFWTAWADPRQDVPVSDPMTSEEVCDWADPLKPRPPMEATLYYGAPYYRYDAPRLYFIPFPRNLFCIPLAVFLEERGDLGLSLALSPDDFTPDLTLATTSDGAVTFSRLFRRLGEGRTVRFSMDLVAHAGDWRAALGWMTRRYPGYFDPVVPAAHEIAGTGAYSTDWVDFDAAKMRGMAFMVNWKASFDFPYMGMFLPPVADDTEWRSFRGEQVTIARLRDYSRKMRALGFHVLNYMNVMEFGAHLSWPPPPRKAAADADLWKDPNDFTYGPLRDAVVIIPPGERETNVNTVNIPGGPYWSWEGCIFLDPGEPVYRDFLLEQARRHMEKLPESSGICIDRLDWCRLYNHDRDDGLSWFADQPVRSLLFSWRSISERLDPIVHGAGKVMYVNNHDKRLDILHHIDGIFDEFTYGGSPLNLTALLCVRRPALGWTAEEKNLRPDPDAFFQKYLYLGVFPMAPFPGNDHSLGPGEWVDRQYLDYGPLLVALRGKRWVLEPHVISVRGSAAKANIFEVPGGYVIPVVYAGREKTVRVALRGLPGPSGGARYIAEALHPGAEARVPVAMTRTGRGLELSVPVRRGCAVVRLTTR